MGIRELKQNPSQAIDWAKLGEEVMVTDRGLPVAKLIPMQLSALEELIFTGEVAKPQGSFAKALRDIKPVRLPSGSLTTDELIALSREEKI